MKDIKKEKKENESNWLNRLETAGDLVSTGLYLRHMLTSGEAVIPAIGAEGLVAGAGAAVGEVATGGMLLPSLGIASVALAAGSGLYHYAKQYLDDNPDDRRGKIIMDNLESRDKRAKNLIGQAFEDSNDDGKYAQAFGV